jgi:hypothetical protein
MYLSSTRAALDLDEDPLLMKELACVPHQEFTAATGNRPVKYIWCPHCETW